MKDVNRHLTKEGKQMANKYIERCSASNVISKLQIKTSMKYCCPSIRIPQIQTLTIPSAGEEVDQQELSLLLMGCKMVQPL